jgi:membrane-anchored mycosin MYCP
MSTQRSVTRKGRARGGRALAAAAAALLVAVGALDGLPPAYAVDRPAVDPGAAPPDGPPGPPVPMRQSSYCTDVGVLPGTDFRVQPKYMDMLNLKEAWRFSRGNGVKVAVIDTGVTPHPRLPNLIPGGDYVMAGGDGLSDCDAHGTIVASMIGAQPATVAEPAGPPRKPPPVPTNEPPPPPQTVTLSPPAPTTVIVPPPPAPSPPPEEQGPPPPFGAPPAQRPSGSSGSGAIVSPGYTGGARVVVADHNRPADPPPAGVPSDAFSGVAPGVQIISIRQTSGAFTPKDAFTGNTDPQTSQKMDNIHTLARAIVHAADMGASVINISEVICMSSRNILDQADLGGAIYHAAVDKNAVIVAAAGDTTQQDCKQNPTYDPLHNDPRDWDGVDTVVTPAWFSKYVLTVGATDASGAPLDKTSMAGPWVSIGAPGTDIEGLSPRSDGLMNAIDGPNNTMLVPAGTGFSAAIVSGVAALVRAKYPQLSAEQVINRLLRTATPPARGVDNQIGYGVVDTIAALTWDVPDGPPPPPQALQAQLKMPPPAPPRDMAPVWVAAGGLLLVLLVAGSIFGWMRLTRGSRRSS